jgi:hypothetical protein
VDHTVDSPQSPRHPLSIAHVAEQEFYVRWPIAWLWVFSVNLFYETIEDADAVTAVQQFSTNSSANKPGSTSHENSFYHKFRVYY